MKRKVVCVFSLILFLLVFCTILSPWVSRQMQTKVEVKRITGNITLHNFNVSTSALRFWETRDTLFQIVEGTGWQSGDRVQEAPRWSYTKDIGLVIINAGVKMDVILSASRQPVVGDAVGVVEEFTEGTDTFLIVWPEGAPYVPPRSYLGSSFTLEADSEERSALASFHKARFPFFEVRYLDSISGGYSQAFRKLYPADEYPEYWDYYFRNAEPRVFSMTEAGDFLRALPQVAAMAVLLLLGIFLWGYGCLLSRRGQGRRALRNAVLCAAIIGGLAILVEHIHLPASFMPTRSILDISHYFSEFSIIRRELSIMGSSLLSEADAAAIIGCALVLLAGAAFVAALLLIDRKWKRK